MQRWQKRLTAMLNEAHGGPSQSRHTLFSRMIPNTMYRNPGLSRSIHWLNSTSTGGAVGSSISSQIDVTMHVPAKSSQRNMVMTDRMCCINDRHSSVNFSPEAGAPNSDSFAHAIAPRVQPWPSCAAWSRDV